MVVVVTACGAVEASATDHRAVEIFGDITVACGVVMDCSDGPYSSEEL